MYINACAWRRVHRGHEAQHQMLVSRQGRRTRLLSPSRVAKKMPKQAPTRVCSRRPSPSHCSHNSHHPRPGRTSMFAKSNHTASSGSSGTQDKRVGMSREVAHAHPASPEAGSIGSHSPGVPDHSPPQRSPLKSRLLSPTALVTSDAAVPEPPKPRSTFLERAEQAALKVILDFFVKP